MVPVWRDSDIRRARKMGYSITQLEYAKRNKGYASVRFRVSRKRAMLIGYSAKYEDELFYFAEIKGKIEGPFYFGSANERAKELLLYSMREKDRVEKRIAESEVIE